MDASTAKKEARSKKTTSARLLELCRHSDPSVQLAVAKNLNTPSAALDSMSIHGKFAILRALALHPNTSSAILERFALHPSVWVRRNVASNSAVPPMILEMLSRDNDDRVRHDVAGQHRISTELLEQFALDSSTFVRRRVAAHPNTSLETIRALSGDPDRGVRCNTVQRLVQDKQHDLIEILVSDEVSVRCEVARRSSAMSARLATDPIALVREAVAKRDDLQTATLKILLADTNALVRCTLVSIETRAVPSFVLEALCADSNVAVRWNVANHRATSAAILERLTHDADADIRALARARLENQ